VNVRKMVGIRTDTVMPGLPFRVVGPLQVIEPLQVIDAQLS
jgi:hypothetical protein